MTESEFERIIFDELKPKTENEISKLTDASKRAKAMRELEKAVDWLEKIYYTLYR